MQSGHGAMNGFQQKNGAMTRPTAEAGIPDPTRPEVVVQVIVPNPRLRLRIEECLRAGGIPTFSDTVLSVDVTFGVISTGVKITAREFGVLDAMLENDFAYEIGEKLGISTKAVENHLQRLMEKMEVHSRHRLVAAAVRSGLLNVMHDPDHPERSSD
ncbi:MAG: Bacterial regulatory protein luxR family [Armatimonadetes bacterium]|jgi:DNA-binding CsgD family transcriptional regulator|nr:Bacterial regulatory protein luxR family [Armatimonadota bacterium]